MSQCIYQHEYTHQVEDNQNETSWATAHNSYVSMKILYPFSKLCCILFDHLWRGCNGFCTVATWHFNKWSLRIGKLTFWLKGYAPVDWNPEIMLQIVIPFDQASGNNVENWNLMIPEPRFANRYLWHQPSKFSVAWSMWYQVTGCQWWKVKYTQLLAWPALKCNGMNDHQV